MFPVVSCRLGHLYSKSSILELLICKKQKKGFPFPDEPGKFLHIKSLRDVQELSIKTDLLNYICPVTGRLLNGLNRFFFIWGCGCMFSESILKDQNLSMAVCPVCSHQYTPSGIVFLSPMTGSRNQLAINRRTISEVEPALSTIPGSLIEDAATHHPNRNADYHPLSRSTFNATVQQKLASVREMSSISSIYTKSNNKTEDL